MSASMKLGVLISLIILLTLGGWYFHQSQGVSKGEKAVSKEIVKEEEAEGGKEEVECDIRVDDIFVCTFEDPFQEDIFCRIRELRRNHNGELYISYYFIEGPNQTNPPKSSSGTSPRCHSSHAMIFLKTYHLFKRPQRVP